MVICVVHLKQNCSHASWQGRLAFLSLPTALPPSTVLPSLSPGDIVPTVTPMATTLPSLSPGAIAGIAVGTIIGLVMIVGILLLVFLCGILVAGMWVFSEEMCGYI